MGVLLTIAACGRLSFDPLDPVDATGATDSPTATSCVPLWISGTFTTNPRLLANVDSNSTEADPFVTADGKTLYFTSDRMGAFDVYRATSVGDEFTNVTLAADLSTPDGDFRASLSTDELTVFMSSNRSGSVFPTANIWTATRIQASDPFTGFTTAPLVNINTGDEQFDPHPSVDLLRLYLSPVVGPDQDIAMASRASTADAFSASASIPIVNSAAGDSDPALSGDERVLVFSSRRGAPAGTGTGHLTQQFLAHGGEVIAGWDVLTCSAAE